MTVLAQFMADNPVLLAEGVQAARRRPTGLGVLCCIGAVLVVLLIVIIARNRRGRGDRGAVD